MTLLLTSIALMVITYKGMEYWKRIALLDALRDLQPGDVIQVGYAVVIRWNTGDMPNNRLVTVAEVDHDPMGRFLFATVLFPSGAEQSFEADEITSVFPKR